MRKGDRCFSVFLRVMLFFACTPFKLQRLVLKQQITLNCALTHVGKQTAVQNEVKSRIVLRTEPVAHVPLTLVRVSTGLLQADSGATRAECFFILTSSDRRSSSRIDYIPKADCDRTALDVSCASSTPDLCSPLPLNTLRYPPAFSTRDSHGAAIHFFCPIENCTGVFTAWVNKPLQWCWFCQLRRCTSTC